MQNCLFIRLLDSFPLAGLFALNQEGLVQLRVHPERLELVPRQPLPRPLVVEEEDEIVGPGVALRQVEDLHRGHGDGDAVVEVSRPRHLGVDDEGGIPGVAAALGPHQVEGLQLDVGCGHARHVAALIPRVALAVLVRTLGQKFMGRVRAWNSTVQLNENAMFIAWIQQQIQPVLNKITMILTTYLFQLLILCTVSFRCRWQHDCYWLEHQPLDSVMSLPVSVSVSSPPP